MQTRMILGCIAAALYAAGLATGCTYNYYYGEACDGIECGEHGACVDRKGEPICLCDKGYRTEGLSCVPEPSSVCEGIDCGAFGTCLDQDGSAACDCAPGYHEVDLTCIAEQGGDPCGGVDCGGNGICIDSGGSPACSCDTGYHPEGLSCVADTGGPCDAVDCGPNGSCVDNAGAAECLCDPGYHAEGLGCVADDGDSCSGIDCGPNGSCVDSGGVPQCSCDPGYQAEGLQCVQASANPCEGVDCGANGSCLDNAGSAECDCDAGYHAEGLTCAEDAPAGATFCQEICAADTDCTMDGQDRGYLCGDQSRCVQCREDADCLAHLSGWWFGTVCTSGGGECAALMQTCIDVGGGVGRCATPPSEFMTCDAMSMADVEMPALDGSGNVTVCGNPDGSCYSDTGYCGSSGGCTTDGECVATYNGWGACGADADCASGRCVDAGGGFGGCAMEPNEWMPCSMMGMDELNLPASDGSGDILVCGYGHTQDAVCREGACYNPCGSDDDCSAMAAGGRPVCDLDTGECVCSQDAHCADVEYVSVCNQETGWCECSSDDDCNTANTVNTDVCVEGRCGCTADPICTGDRVYDETSWTCE